MLLTELLESKKKFIFNGQYLGFRVSFMHGGKIYIRKKPQEVKQKSKQKSEGEKRQKNENYLTPL